MHWMYLSIRDTRGGWLCPWLLQPRESGPPGAGGQAGAAAHMTSSWITACTQVGEAPEGKGREGSTLGQGRTRERRGAEKEHYSLDRRTEADVEPGKRGSSRKVSSVCF